MGALTGPPGSRFPKAAAISMSNFKRLDVTEWSRARRCGSLLLRDVQNAAIADGHSSTRLTRRENTSSIGGNIGRPTPAACSFKSRGDS